MTAEIWFVYKNTMQYEQARILDSGWVKATNEDGEAEYIAPHRIESITGDRVHVGDGDSR